MRVSVSSALGWVAFAPSSTRDPIILLNVCWLARCWILPATKGQHSFSPLAHWQRTVLSQSLENLLLPFALLDSSRQQTRHLEAFDSTKNHYFRVLSLFTSRVCHYLLRFSSIAVELLESSITCSREVDDKGEIRFDQSLSLHSALARYLTDLPWDS